MRIGVPREVKAQEYRVALIPSAVAQLCQAGHQLWVETQAGEGSGYSDYDYRQAGAQISPSADELYARAELLVKVKEPQAAEIALLRSDLTLFCYLHLAPDAGLTEALLNSGVRGVAYETITDEQGRLPLLKPMSEIAGRLATQAGAHCLEKAQGGSGVLLGSVGGLAPGHVLVMGGGVVGSHAAEVALGMGARVTVVEPAAPRRQALRTQFSHSRFQLIDSADFAPERLKDVDIVIGAALVPGASAPKLLQRQHLSALLPGSVLVDVAVDQGGCFETTRPTTHAQPTFIEAGVVHYCVANIPSAVARTASQALSNATVDYVLKLANGPLPAVLEGDPHLAAGLNVAAGQLCCQAVAEAQQRPYTSLDTVLKSLS